MDGNPMMMFGAAGAAASYFMLLNATVFLATQERDRRRSNTGFGLHFGPGVYDDYEFLFSEEGRAGYSDASARSTAATPGSRPRIAMKNRTTTENIFTR